MQNEEADLGIFVATTPPSSCMRTEASRAGTYRHPFLEMEVPRLQIYEIQNYFFISGHFVETTLWREGSVYISTN